MKLQYCVYVLYSLSDDKFYIGFTENLKRRLAEHFSGKNISTRSRRLLRLIFCEYYLSKSDACRREKYFKTSVGKRCLRIMIKKSLDEIKE
jgi:putative endonuclease